MNEESEQWAKVRRIYQKTATGGAITQELTQVINSLLARVSNLERRLADIEKK
jgi:hypothetical protein